MRIPAAILLSLVSLLPAAVQGAEITATSLDGSTTAGSLKSWDDGQLVIVDSSGEHTVATDRLLSARLAPAQPSKPIVVSGQTAELIDGTLFPIASLKVVGQKAVLEATQPNGSSPPIEIPITQIEAIRFRPMDAALATQWDEIRALNRVTDLLVVLKRDGQSLDYVEGVVGDISADKVAFKLDGESNAVDRAKVAGIIYYRADRAPQAESRVTLQGKSGLRARAAKIHLAGANVNLTTPSGIKFDWPVDDIELADFSAGKLMYLSDIEPASQNWSPLDFAARRRHARKRIRPAPPRPVGIRRPAFRHDEARRGRNRRARQQRVPSTKASRFAVEPKLFTGSHQALIVSAPSPALTPPRPRPEICGSPSSPMIAPCWRPTSPAISPHFQSMSKSLTRNG